MIFFKESKSKKGNKFLLFSGWVGGGAAARGSESFFTKIPNLNLLFFGGGGLGEKVGGGSGGLD